MMLPAAKHNGRLSVSEQDGSLPAIGQHGDTSGSTEELTLCSTVLSYGKSWIRGLLDLQPTVGLLGAEHPVVLISREVTSSVPLY